MVAVAMATGFAAVVMRVAWCALDELPMVMAGINMEINGPRFGAHEKRGNGQYGDRQAHRGSIT